MAQIVKKLTEHFAKSVIDSGYYADGGGLYLQVSRVGTKNWIYRFTLRGKTRDMGLGSLHAVTLTAARQRAREARLLRERGEDPIEARRSQRAAERDATGPAPIIFRDFAEQFIASRENDWKNKKHRKQWRATIENYAYPVIGDLPIAEIDTPDILKIIEPMWREKSETASRLRGRIERILAAASVRGLRQGNPAMWKGHLKEALPAKRRAVSFPAMPYDRLPSFFERLQRHTGIAARALEFTILNAVRSGETFGARWLEIDLSAGLWTIPAERMKAGREHVVPLSPLAVHVLERMSLLRSGDSSFVFPGKRDGKPLSSMAMTKLMRRMDEGEFTVHGFRSSFRDWCGDCTTFSREIAEAALAHSIPDKTEAAYRRGTAIEQRRRLMDLWSSFCAAVDSQPGVIALRA